MPKPQHESNKDREVWQRGPVEGVPDLLQPVAHALLQSREDAYTYTTGLGDHLLWDIPDGRASVGFHLKHMAGVVDRLFTYASEKPLNAEQKAFLKAEGKPIYDAEKTRNGLLELFNDRIGSAVEELKQTPEQGLTEERFLGRAMIPTTKIGLLFHAAEHCQRHIGQLLVTVDWVIANQSKTRS